MWFDTHCHLYQIADEGSLDDVMGRAEVAGVSHMLTVGVDAQTSQRCLELARSWTQVHAGAAFHPSESKGWEDSWADAIDELLLQPEVVAVGETGLDLYWDKTYLGDQLRMFTRHIELAKKHDKTLVIHTRDSIEEALELLESQGAPARLVFHCWSGPQGALHRALSLGAHISFAGNVSFRNAPDLRTAAALVPGDRLLVETDAPYLSPVPMRGRPNEPAYVVYVGEAVAGARGVDVEAIAEMTSRNARSLFGV